MNVLIYTGPGVSKQSVKSVASVLKRHLGEFYTVIEVGAKVLAEEPWQPSTSLLVFPGGRDLLYLKELVGRANKNIREYVFSGGRYLGICAGSYYASGRCEFEPNTELEVIGDRPLQFYPGTCRGLAFKGFRYDSEVGARIVPLTVTTSDNRNIEKCLMYYNGGGTFFKAEQHLNTKILATYDETTETGSQTAVVLCSVGEQGGKALLSAVHPELDITPETPPDLDQLVLFKQKIDCIFRSWLSLLGLKLNEDLVEAPNLTNIQIIYPKPENSPHINWLSSDPNSSVSLFQRLRAQANPDSGLFEDNNENLKLQLLSSEETCNAGSILDSQQTNSKNTLIVIGCDDPNQVFGGTFHPETYFKALKEVSYDYVVPTNQFIPFFGAPLIYSEVVSSTQVILEKNPKFLQTLPCGTTFVACRQVTGKGRGRNAWVSPLGCLQFSYYFKHPIVSEHQTTTSAVLIQYLQALAVVEGIRLVPGYEDLAIHLKWPNDIYGLDYRELGPDGSPSKKKVGGILVNSFSSGNSFSIVVGTGINTSNTKPTICINDLIDQLNSRRNQEATEKGILPEPPLIYISQEQYLALILNRFRHIYTQFMVEKQGLSPFLDRYYKYWLHSHQLVTLSDQNKVQARVLGITPDYGLLEVVTVDPNSGRINPVKCQRFVLQPDGNSFDMMTGLISKKVTS